MISLPHFQLLASQLLMQLLEGELQMHNVLVLGLELNKRGVELELVR